MDTKRGRIRFTMCSNHSKIPIVGGITINVKNVMKKGVVKITMSVEKVP